MSLERNSGNIDFGMSISVSPEVNATGAEYDRDLEERQARERLADIMEISEKPVAAEPTPARQHEKLTGAAILQLVNRRGRNLEITRSRAAGTDQREAA